MVLADTADNKIVDAWIAKIANNPFIPVTKARTLAAALDVSGYF